MSELKPCLCGGKAKFVRETVKTTANEWCDSVYVKCTKRGAKSTRILYNAELYLGGEEYQDAATEWNRRDKPANVPLTLEELRGMIGNPVWVTHKDGSGGRWGIVNQYDIGLCADINAGTAYWFDDYCGTIAYRRKPESEADA